MLGLVVCVLVVLGTALTQNTDEFELNIIHYNDFHAHYDEVSPEGSECQPAVKPCIGGFARLYTAIMEAREAEPDSLLLNAGDTFQGTIWYNFLRWNVSQHFMNMLPHDAHVLGNHDFDHGVEGLVPYLERLDAPMLGANVNTTFEPTMTPYIRNHVIVEKKGRRIGIIGVLLRNFSGPIGQVIMEDELTAVNREAAILSGLGVDIIIVLSHIGFSSDIALASQVSTDVDIIVGSHSHTLLYNGETPNGDTATSEYPTVVTQSNGHQIPIVQALCYTRYLGNIKLVFNSEGRVVRWEGQPIFLGSSIVQDPRIMKLLEPWREEVSAVGKEVLGRSLVTLSRSECKRGECNIGSWACDGFLAEVMPRAGRNWNDTHVCMINSGGIRVQINPGDVTTAGLLMVMPFENYMQVFDLKGEFLQEALESSVSELQSEPGHFYSQKMLQIGGMRNTYNGSAAVGSRVTSTVRCIECDVPRYEPLDPEKTYRVVTSKYIGDGGEGFTMISDNRKNVVNLEVDYVMLQNYLRRQKTIVQELDGRINIVW